jgi:hypothetical protein
MKKKSITDSVSFGSNKHLTDIRIIAFKQRRVPVYVLHVHELDQA